jgi:hypothetical protein
MCVAHLLSALTAGAVLVVQPGCTALACGSGRGRPTAMHQADPAYVQVHSRSAFQSTTRQPTSKGPCYSTLSVGQHHVDGSIAMDTKVSDLALQQSLSTQRWFTGWPAQYTSTKRLQWSKACVAALLNPAASGRAFLPPTQVEC